MTLPGNGLIHECSDYRNKFKVVQALWNPNLDVLALASLTGEICLKRFYWKTGWQKKLSKEILFYSKKSTSEENASEVGDFSHMCWSHDGTVLVVAFESGICHFLDVNDALILYSIRLDSKPLQLKWFKIEGLSMELNEAKRKQMFSNEKSFNSFECENLRTKDSESQRDNYKIVYGVQNFCHSKINASLMDSVLVVVGEKDDFLGFDVYMSGMFLIKSVIFDCDFLASVCDPFQLKVLDFCLLDNQNLQFALSAPLKEDVSVRPQFDQTPQFPQPIDEQEKGESTYIVEYDLDFNNKDLMTAAALLAARSCHVYHLLTSLRENFQRACQEWESISEQFHTNVFGTLYSKYEEETEGLLADFALDFIAYILTGNYNETFSQAFFRDIKLKDWKPAREFVVKHIPAFLHCITKYLTPIVDILFVHLNSLKGEIQRFERNLQSKWTHSKSLSMLNLSKCEERSRPVEQLDEAIQAVCHLSKLLKSLEMIGNKNWAELKYVLQLLSSHPDNEQLKMDIEDDYDGIKRMDFEILLTFITDALIDKEKKAEFGNWIKFLHHWKAKLLEAKTAKVETPLICNPNWLKHRLFDKIGPLLGTCQSLPKPKPQKRKSGESQSENQTIEEATTINDAIQSCFSSLNEIYLFGLRDLNGNNDQPNYSNTYCLEFCHPQKITKLQLHKWSFATKQNRFQQKDEQTENLKQLMDFKIGNQLSECKSVILVHRSSCSTLQCYLTIKGDDKQRAVELTNECSPQSILKLEFFGPKNELTTQLQDKLDTQQIETKFKEKQYKVLDFGLYGCGSLHMIVSFNDEVVEKDACSHILRANLLGNLLKVEETPISYATNLSFYPSAFTQLAILFERHYESLRWFELEPNLLAQKRRDSLADKEQRILMAHSVQQIDKATARSALNRKRKLNAKADAENRRPLAGSLTAELLRNSNSNDSSSFAEDELNDEDEEEVDLEEPTAEQLKNGYLVVELEEPSTPARLPSPSSYSNGSPVMLQINEFAAFTPPSHTAPTTPPHGILNLVRFGSPATASTASSPNRVVGEEEEERTEDQEDFAIDEDANTNRVNDDEDDRTEHDIEIVDSLENSRDDEVLHEHNREDLPPTENENEDIEMEHEPNQNDNVRADEEEETREAM